MNSSGGEDEKHRGEKDHPQDLIDFYRRWRSEFRQTAVLLSQRADLSPLQFQTMHWMIVLLDRISDHDLQPRERRCD